VPQLCVNVCVQILGPVQLYTAHSLLLLCICSSWPLHAAAACAGGDSVVAPCPTALAAAQALTGNNAQLPVSNAAFSGRCTPGDAVGMLLITDFGCHYLAASMPLGECNWGAYTTHHYLCFAWTMGTPKPAVALGASTHPDP
jgi:hypothetical protein